MIHMIHYCVYEHTHFLQFYSMMPNLRINILAKNGIKTLMASSHKFNMRLSKHETQVISEF